MIISFPLKIIKTAAVIRKREPVFHTKVFNENRRISVNKNYLFKKILDNMHDGAIYFGADMRIAYSNKAAEIITGFSAKEIKGKHCAENFLGRSRAEGRDPYKTGECGAAKAVRENIYIEEELFIRHREGHQVPVVSKISPVVDDNGTVAGAVEILNDNKAALDAFRKIEKLEALAFIDGLTGAGNRRYTEIKINTKLEEMNRYSWAPPFGMLFIDIDYFKAVNDKYGHGAGDEILKMITKTAVANLRTEDFFGRWGGEEFAAIITDVDRKRLYSIAEKMRFLAEKSEIHKKSKKISVTISIGATLAKKEDTIEKLMKRADVLLYESKASGRNTVTIG